jgi:hypothetical protein
MAPVPDIAAFRISEMLSIGKRRDKPSLPAEVCGKQFHEARIPKLTRKRAIPQRLVCPGEIREIRGVFALFSQKAMPAKPDRQKNATDCTDSKRRYGTHAISIQLIGPNQPP